ncbi:hypothetical protein [Deinococcus gobiensis]|nr:hypothetical protein [Deinococcus gobiensis]
MKSIRLVLGTLFALIVTAASVAGASPVGGYGLEKAPTTTSATTSAS